MQKFAQDNYLEKEFKLKLHNYIIILFLALSSISLVPLSKNIYDFFILYSSGDFPFKSYVLGNLIVESLSIIFIIFIALFAIYFFVLKLFKISIYNNNFKFPFSLEKKESSEYLENVGNSRITNIVFLDYKDIEEIKERPDNFTFYFKENSLYYYVLNKKEKYFSSWEKTFYKKDFNTESEYYNFLDILRQKTRLR